jgi:hypothetical protein
MALEFAPARPAEVLPCFARRVKGLPRFHGAFLVQAGGSWHLVYRRWFRTRSLSFDAAPGPVRTFPGLLWDTAVFLLDGRPQILLTGRDWRHALPTVPATP